MSLVAETVGSHLNFQVSRASLRDYIEDKTLYWPRAGIIITKPAMTKSRFVDYQQVTVGHSRLPGRVPRSL